MVLVPTICSKTGPNRTAAALVGFNGVQVFFDVIFTDHTDKGDELLHSFSELVKSFAGVWRRFDHHCYPAYPHVHDNYPLPESEMAYLEVMTNELHAPQLSELAVLYREEYFAHFHAEMDDVHFSEYSIITPHGMYLHFGTCRQSTSSQFASLAAPPSNRFPSGWITSGMKANNDCLMPLLLPHSSRPVQFSGRFLSDFSGRRGSPMDGQLIESTWEASRSLIFTSVSVVRAPLNISWMLYASLVSCP